MLAKYKQYLQSCYNARVLAPADKYLPTLESPYINLAMIRRGRYNHKERDEFTRRTLHGGVDQILENKTSINIEDLLTPEDRDVGYQMRVEGGEWLIHESRVSSMLPFMLPRYPRRVRGRERMRMPFSKTNYTESLVVPEYSEAPVTHSQTTKSSKRPVRFILVEGPPGIGKSTFAWEVCRRWDEIESLRDYHTVLLLKLREKWVLNATSLSDLLRYPSHPDFSYSIAEELVKSQGQKLLFVLDGFDEVSHSFHENSVIKSILCRQLLPECTIILTTRQVAKATLKSICQPRVDKHIEIIGFTEEERVRYITEVFSKEPELQVNFLKYMFLVPHIKSMMYIPLNCAIIAQVYYESQSSHHLAIPRTRTQLYKALTHSLLVRHIQMKETKCMYTSLLPEGLDGDNIKTFKTLAKFAFDTYHKGKSRKVTFFKEDVPEGFVHFGFMNESTEMYAGKGMEQTFSFLHLSLQEYLAAWHLAENYSIQFQVAYHRLAVEQISSFTFQKDRNTKQNPELCIKGNNKEEKALISSLQRQRSSLEEPAIFLAGITGWRCQSEDDRNHWEIYLSHDTVATGDASLLLRSLYEAQNPTLFPHYFTDTQSKFLIGSFGGGIVKWNTHINPCTPYDCYALSYSLAISSDKMCHSLSFGFNKDNDIPLMETFVKGLDDHCLTTTLRVNNLEIRQSSPSLVDRGLLWLMKANFLAAVEESVLQTTIINSCCAETFIQSLVNLQSLKIHDSFTGMERNTSATYITSWKWLTGLKSHSKMKVLQILCTKESSPPPTDIHSWLEHGLIEGDNELTEVLLDIKFPSNTIDDIHSPIHVLINSVLKSVLRSNQITYMILPNISRDTMAGVHHILLHCPSLTRLELKRTRLGYDGILYICTALRNNTTLRYLVIHDLQLPPTRNRRQWGDARFICFLSTKIIPLPAKTTCTDFLLELNNILKDNTTLEEMKIQSGLFVHLSTGDYGYYCQWTGLGPLQQFNVGAVGSGISPNLRRSFSSSDITQPQTTLFWNRHFFYKPSHFEVDFKKLFSKRKEEGKELLALPSFTAPDTEVLQSFSGLDPRLEKCLEIFYLHQYVERIKRNYWGRFEIIKEHNRHHYSRQRIRRL